MSLERATPPEVHPGSGWIVVNAGGYLIESTFARTRAEAIRGCTYGDNWRALKRRYGLRCIRVDLVPRP